MEYLEQVHLRLIRDSFDDHFNFIPITSENISLIFSEWGPMLPYWAVLFSVNGDSCSKFWSTIYIHYVVGNTFWTMRIFVFVSDLLFFKYRTAICKYSEHWFTISNIWFNLVYILLILWTSDNNYNGWWKTQNIEFNLLSS